jgi:F-type H+-transporting ATPase subunit delta
MFRRTAAGLFRSSAAALQVKTLPLGFDYLDGRIQDKDGPVEPAQSLSLTLTRQDEFIYKGYSVRHVQLSTLTGEIGVMPNHEYKITRLLPGVINVEESEGKFVKYFTSGGFAHINNDGQCDINTVECMPLEDLDLALAEKELAQANGKGTTEKEKAIAEAQVQVLEALVNALKANSGGH